MFYASLIWYCDIISTTQNLEAVQHCFLRFLSFKFKVERPLYTEYNGILSYLDLESLNKRREPPLCIFSKPIKQHYRLPLFVGTNKFSN